MTKILIVDDDHTMADLLKILLELDGFNVIHETREGSLVATVRDEKPDVVLMDVFLTDSDGLDLLAEVRADEGITGTRIVMTSGMELREQAFAAGADAFLLKPYTPDQLISTIREVTDSGS
jgi:DNA-binding response OmpR family regulator